MYLTESHLLKGQIHKMAYILGMVNSWIPKVLFNRKLTKCSCSQWCTSCRTSWNLTSMYVDITYTCKRLAQNISEGLKICDTNAKCTTAESMTPKSLIWQFSRTTSDWWLFHLLRIPASMLPAHRPGQLLLQPHLPLNLMCKEWRDWLKTYLHSVFICFFFILRILDIFNDLQTTSVHRDEYRSDQVVWSFIEVNRAASMPARLVLNFHQP